MDEAASSRFRWVFLLNVDLVAAASLPLLFAEPVAFTRPSIPSLESRFFVQSSAAWHLVEAIASYLVWRPMSGNADLAFSIAFLVYLQRAARPAAWPPDPSRPTPVLPISPRATTPL